MKRQLLIFFSLVIILLSGCSMKVADKPNELNEEAISWEMMPSSFQEMCTHVTLLKDEIYAVVVGYNGTTYICTQYNDLYSTNNFDIIGFCEGNDCLWVLERNVTDNTHQVLKLESSGKILETFPLAKSEYKVNHGKIRGNQSEVYFISGQTLFSIESPGNFITYDLPYSDMGIAKGNNGLFYLFSKLEDETRVYQVEKNTKEIVYCFSLPKGENIDGYGQYLVEEWTDETIYGILQSGEKIKILEAQDAGVSLSGILTMYPYSGGGFLCEFLGKLMELSPVPDTNQGHQLLIATIGEDDLLQKQVAAYNRTSKSVHITIKDYSDGGELTADQALNRLNTELTSGAFPDMICFSGISPFPYIARGLLVDLKSLIDQDTRISTDDLCIYHALTNSDSLFYAGSGFTFETLIVKSSELDSDGWTIQDCVKVSQTIPNETMLFYNMTREKLLNRIGSKYSQSTIDWVAGTCNYSNDDFIKVLELCKNIKETPENENNELFGFGSSFINTGELFSTLSYVDSVWKLAFEKRMAGCDIKVVGWPTVDGKRGSDVAVYSPVGIVSGGNKDESWNFIYYCITEGYIKSDNYMPVYYPTLLDEIAYAKTKDSPVVMTDEDELELIRVIERLDNSCYYDEAVNKIVETEAKRYFAGDRTADEVAKVIQDKVSLYLEEQK